MRILKNLLVGLVITWGLLALLVRAATPLISDHREQLAALASARLGTPVTIGAIEARWYGARPLLELHAVAIGPPERQLRVDNATLDLAITRLLRGSLLDALRVTVDGMQLTLVREPGDQLHLTGFGPIGADGFGAPPPLPRHLRLLNTRVVWIDRQAGRAPLTIDKVAVVLNRRGTRLQLRASLRTVSGRAELSARVEGSLATTRWHGDSYLRVDDLDVAHLFAPYVPSSYGLRELGIDLEVWTRWQDARPVQAQGRFALRDLDLQPRAQNSAALRVAQAGAQFSFQRTADELRLGLRDLQLATGGRHWPPGDLAFALAAQPGGGTRVRVAADFLRIEDVAGILRVRLPWPELEQPLGRYRPRGELRDLRLEARTGGDGPFDWRATARFAGLGSEPFGDVPGVDRLSGELHGQRGHLLLRLDSRDSVLRFSDLFREPLELLRLRGRVDLAQDAAGWQLRSDELLADTPHLSTRTRLALRAQPDAPLFLDLQSDFRDGDAAFASRYYPVKVMGRGLVNWLDHSILSGRITGGTALVHGPLDSFAFEKAGNGIFQVVFDAHDVELDYRAGWPKLERLDARVEFHGNHLDITASSGLIYDSQVRCVSARVDSLKPAGPIRIRGRLDGPLRNYLRVFNEDALRERFGQFSEALQGSGDTRLVLDFTLPLGGLGEYALDGQLHFDGARLTLPEWDFDISDIAGQLDFTLDGLSAQGIKGHALGAPVALDVLPLADGGTRVRARGRVATGEIARKLPSLTSGLARGKADFVVDVDIPPGNAPRGSPSVLSVGSNLKGVAIALPAPFGKAADEVRRLAVKVPLGGRSAAGSLAYADQVSARFSGDGARIDVAIGGEARLRPERGIRVSGSLPETDLDSWLALLQHLPAGAGDNPAPVVIDLRIDRLLADPLVISRLHLDAARSAQGWQGSIEAAEIAGRFSLATPGPAPLRIDLERLQLEVPLDDDLPDLPPPDPRSGPDPASLPDVELTIADLLINEARLGRLKLSAQRTPRGLQIREFELRDGQLVFTGNGAWAGGDNGYQTDLQGEMESPNIGDLLVGLGYSRQIEEAAGHVGLRLQWPGGPRQFHQSTLRGAVDLDFGAGRLAELDPGATRVVGLLNLNALTRRLRLDFSDFYRKGYSFDSIKGAFQFSDGLARTDDLTVLGPSGRIEVKGSADLVARSLDQRVTVTPKLDATLPIAGTIAGGPVAGIAVLVAQHVLTDQVDNMVRFEYELSGPWVDPEITQLDSGGTLSKILQQFQRRDDAPGAADDAGHTPTPAEPAAPEAAPAEDTGHDAGADDGSAAEGEAASEGSAITRPLRGLIDLLKKGKRGDPAVPDTGD